jgi:hypothetical protein
MLLQKWPMQQILESNVAYISVLDSMSWLALGRK